MRYTKVSHVMYQSWFISDMLNINNSKNQKQLMPIIPNINTCKCQSFWRSEMSSFNNVNVNCAQYQKFKVPMLTSISLNLINRVKYQLCQSQKWQYHLCGDELCARRILVSTTQYSTLRENPCVNWLISLTWLRTVLSRIFLFSVRKIENNYIFLIKTYQHWKHMILL